MQDYIVISTGPKGKFQHEATNLGDATTIATKELQAGQEAHVYVRYGQVKFTGATIEKSQAQVDAEAEAKVAAAEEAKP